MNKFQKLLECLSSSDYKRKYASAKSSLTCIMCHKDVDEFRKPSNKMEYDISALCQKCQDACFGCE